MMNKFKSKKIFNILLCLLFITNIFIPNLSANAIVGTLKVSYIDVGQGDSELIQSNGCNMLIDAGTSDSQDSLCKYLKNAGVKEINVLVATHPHADHIGGMTKILKSYKVDKIIMPKVTTTTKTFRELIQAIKDKGLKITAPVPKTSFNIGNATCTILAPVSTNYDNLNNYSVVIRMVYGNNSFMFDGDAEAQSEQEMLGKGYNLSADVLKLGHHGSRTASSEAFLNKVSPKFAIISCGNGNDYGHPHDETIKKLLKRHITFYRTDVNGSIICTSDGKKISFTTTGNPKPNNTITPDSPNGVVNAANVTQASTKTATSTTTTSTQNNPNKDTIVYITKTGKDYHTANCSSLKHSKIPIKLGEAISKGYKPHKECGALVLK